MRTLLEQIVLHMNYPPRPASPDRPSPPDRQEEISVSCTIRIRIAKLSALSGERWFRRIVGRPSMESPKAASTPIAGVVAANGRGAAWDGVFHLNGNHEGDEEEEEGLLGDGALAERVLSQAIDLQAQQEKIVLLEEKLRDAVTQLEQRGDPAPKKRSVPKSERTSMAKLSERLEKAERRAIDFTKRFNTATAALKSRDKELKNLRFKAERLERENAKAEKKNQLLQNHVSRIESRLRAAVNTKDDTENMKIMSQKLSAIAEENESLHTKLSESMEENIVLSESLNEVRRLVDDEAFTRGLEDGGQVLVELSQQKQICSLLENDNKLLLNYIKDLRVTSQTEDLSVLRMKLSNPVQSDLQGSNDAEDLMLQKRLESFREELQILGGALRAQEERETLLITTSNEERAQLNAARQELGEAQSKCDGLTFQCKTLKKKCVHLKSVLKSLNAFCAQVSKLANFKDMSDVDEDKLDEMERHLINTSVVTGPSSENRAFIKLIMSLMGSAMEQRRECIAREEEMGLMRETIKEMSGKVAALSREKALAEKELLSSRHHDDQETILFQASSGAMTTASGITGGTVGTHRTKAGSYSTPSLIEETPRPQGGMFAFKTKSFADSLQEEGGRESTGAKSVTSRTLKKSGAGALCGEIDSQALAREDCLLARLCRH